MNDATNDGKPMKVLNFNYMDVPVNIIDWKGSLLLRINIDIHPIMNERISKMSREELDILIGGLAIDLKNGRTAHTINFDGKMLHNISFEQTIIFAADHPETVQRLIDAIYETTNLAVRTIIKLMKTLELSEETNQFNIRQSGPMFG